MEDEIRPLTIGKGEVLREGEDVLLLAIGSTVHPALQAAALLHAEGIGVTVVNSRFVVPFDEELIGDLAAQHRVLVTAEENVITGGFGSAVLEFLHATGNSPPRVHRLGIPARFVEHSPQAVLRKQYHLDAEGIAQEIRTALNHGKGAAR